MRRAFGFATYGMRHDAERFDADARCATVAAASIVAKVTRDRLMLEADKQFPEYGFARHKGYGTPEHQAAIRRLGVTVARDDLSFLMVTLARLCPVPAPASG